MRNCEHSSESVFVKKDSDIERDDWLLVFTPIHPKGRLLS